MQIKEGRLRKGMAMSASGVTKRRGADGSAERGDVRNFYGWARVVEGAMGRGAVVVCSDGVADVPVATVSVPFASEDTNMRIAHLIEGVWNEGKTDPAKAAGMALEGGCGGSIRRGEGDGMAGNRGKRG